MTDDLSLRAEFMEFAETCTITYPLLGINEGFQHWRKTIERKISELEAENNKIKSLIGMKDDSLETYDEFYKRCLVAMGYPENENQSSAMDDLIIEMLQIGRTK